MRIVVQQQETPEEVPSTPLPFLPAGFTPEGVPSHLVHESTLRLLRLAFAPKLNIDLFLACLLRYATLDPRTSIQLSLFRSTGESQDVAIILFLSEEALANSPNWSWGAETTHKIILVLEALRVIRRVFHRTYTEIHFFLGAREISLPEILLSLQQLHDKRKNKKVKQIAKRAMKRLQTGEFVAHTAHASHTIHAQSGELAQKLQQVTQIIGAVLRKHGVEGQQEIIEQAGQIIGHILQPASYSLPEGRVSALSGEFLASYDQRFQVPSPRKGESIAQKGEFVNAEKAVSAVSNTASDQPKGEFVTADSPFGAMKRQKQANRRRQTRPCEVKTGESAAMAPTESPDIRQTRPLLADSPISGDLAVAALSSKESLYIRKDSERTESFDIEKTEPASEHSLKDIQAEATYLWMNLYTDRQRQEPQSDRYVGGFISRLQEHPELVRASMINVLLQREFPDKKFGPPQGGGSQWFYRTYKRYANGTLAITPEIQSWVDSSYSYSQIEAALKRERERQQREGVERRRAHLPWFNEPIRPFAWQYDEIIGAGDVEGESVVDPGQQDKWGAQGAQGAQGVEEWQENQGDALPPGYPPPEAPWTVDTVLYLFDALRGYPLTGMSFEYAIPFAEAIVYGGEVTQGQTFTRFQVEYTQHYFQLYQDQWKECRAEWDSETGIPDVWFVASVIADVWPCFHESLLKTGHYVEMEDGDLLTYEQYQALYERAEQAAYEEQRDEVSFSPTTLESWHRQYEALQQGGTLGEREGNEGESRGTSH